MAATAEPYFGPIRTVHIWAEIGQIFTADPLGRCSLRPCVRYACMTR